MDITPDMRVYDLEQSRQFGAPIHPAHAPGYVYTLHRRHEAGMPEARTGASGFMYMADHAGTHIDALCHQAENLHLYGEREINVHVQTSTGFTQLGVETIDPIITRGVLLDVAGHAGVEFLTDGAIGKDELETVARAQGVSIHAGDVVLVRTGNGAHWHDSERYLRASGMGSDASLWLAELGVKAVGADNMAWENVNYRDPESHVSLPGHLILLVRNGIYIIENVFLEDLAKDRRYEFTFVCIPLKLRGATGSPVRPIALVP